ncbi:vesicle transport protein USE1-like [Amphiura filiformis]|uniref:vesicle transport protein USE1-like n=1 Tax=Amphiura filiformis TaxID=82378 RepID=UPI003B212376
MPSRLEINFQRLLARCETMAGDKDRGDWRLEKYVCALQDKIAELKKAPSPPTDENMTEYNKKVEFLKGLIQAEKLSSPSEKAQAGQLLAPAKSATLPDHTKSSALTSTSKEIHLKAESRYTNEMRKELLGEDDSSPVENGIRHRRKHDEMGSSTEDLDAVMQHHHNIQEKLAEDMLSLTRSLKHNTVVAGNIIQDDNRKLEDTLKLADTNYDKLKVESERLEAHTKRACNWWLWGALAAVCMTFLWMILFIRLFPKRS